MWVCVIFFTHFSIIGHVLRTVIDLVCRCFCGVWTSDNSRRRAAPHWLCETLFHGEEFPPGTAVGRTSDICILLVPYCPERPSCLSSGANLALYALKSWSCFSFSLEDLSPRNSGDGVRISGHQVSLKVSLSSALVLWDRWGPLAVFLTLRIYFLERLQPEDWLCWSCLFKRPTELKQLRDCGQRGCSGSQK